MPNEIELLKQANDTTVMIALIVAGSAMLGSFIQYLVSRDSNKITADKIKADLISTERLRWLQELRNRYSIFCALLDSQISFLERPIHEGEIQNYQKSIDEFSRKLSEHSCMILTLLNPDKTEQLKLRESIMDCQHFFIENLKNKQSVRNGQLEGLDMDMEKYIKIKDKSLIALTVIGKETWSKIKELK